MARDLLNGVPEPNDLLGAIPEPAAITAKPKRPAKPATTPRDLGAIPGLDPDLASRVSRAQTRLSGMGITLTLSDAELGGVRTEQQQAALRARKGTMAAKAGPDAPHVSGRALDLAAIGKGVAGIRDPRVRQVLQEEGLVSRVPGEPWHWESGSSTRSARSILGNVSEPSALAGIPEPQALARPKVKRSNKEVIGDLMGELVRGAHLKGSPARPAPAVAPKGKTTAKAKAPSTTMPAPLARLQKIPGVGEVAQDVYQSIVPALQAQKASIAAGNALGTQLHRSSTEPDPDYLLKRGVLNAARAGAEAFGDLNSNPGKPRALSNALGVTDDMTPFVRWPAAIGDLIVGVRTDPLNVLADPLLKAAGETVKPLVTAGARKLGNAAKAAAQTGTARTLGRAGEKVVDTLLVPGATKAAVRGAKTAAAYVGLGPDAARKAQEVREALNHAPEILKGYEAATGAVKGALVANSGTQAGNIIGNHLMSKLALDNAGYDGHLLNQFLPGAVAETKAAIKGRLSPAIIELNQHSNAFSQTFSRSAGVPAGSGGLAGLALKGIKGMLSVQEFAEKSYKLGLFKALRSQGMNPAQAAKVVDDYLFNYADRSALVTFMDRYGVAPFVTFGAKAFKAFVDGVAHRPDLMRRFLQARERMFADPQDRANYEKLPEYERGLFTLPIGHGQYLNLNRFNPFKGALDTVQAGADFAAGRLSLKQLAREVATRPLPAAAVLNVGLNQQTLGSYDKPRRVSDPGAPSRDRVPVHLRELVKAYGPSGRALVGIIEAVEGISPSDPSTAKAVPLDEATLRSTLGLRSVTAEDDAARRKTLAPLVKMRRAVAVPVAREVIRQTRANPAGNPFLPDVADLNHADAQAQARLTERYLTTLYESGRVVNDRGQLTGNGKARLTRAVQYLFALRDRVAATRPKPKAAK